MVSIIIADWLMIVSVVLYGVIMGFVVTDLLFDCKMSDYIKRMIGRKNDM